MFKFYFPKIASQLFTGMLQSTKGLLLKAAASFILVGRLFAAWKQLLTVAVFDHNGHLQSDIPPTRKISKS
jgi:hypothetical protein